MIELLKKPQTIYAGFDPTADSLHVGNLLIITTLIRFLREGHQVICLIGDGTASIGDPSGKSTERPLMTQEEINRNADGISSDLNKIFANHFKYFWKRSSNHKTELREPM